MNPMHLLFASALTTASILAQSTSTQPLTSGVVPFHGVEQEVWGATASYKVSLGGQMAFIPYLGSDYPHNELFSWETESATLGGAELATHPASLAYSLRRAEYDLGGIVEAYDLRADGLEQTFILPCAAEAAGGLAIVGRLRSTLRTEDRRAQHAPLEFVNSTGEPIVRYGAAIAIDALGRRVPMSSAFDDGRITLALSAEQVAELVFPVVVDPVVATIAQISGAALGEMMDCVRDDENDRIYTVFSRFASAQDEDVLGQVTDDAWTPTISYFHADVSASWNSSYPQVASVGGADRVIVVYARDSAAGNSIQWHAHDHSDPAFRSVSTTIPKPANSSAWRPDVGGSAANVAGSVAMVVAQAEGVPSLANTNTSRIVAIPIDIDSSFGQGSILPATVLASSATRDFERPRINQQSEGFGSGNWVVCWQRYDNAAATGNWRAVVRVVDTVGGPLTPETLVERSSDHQMGPLVAGDSGHYSIAYGRIPPGGPAKPSIRRSNDIRVRAFAFDGVALTFHPNLSSLTELGVPINNRVWVPEGFAADTESRSHWLLTLRNTASETAWVALTGYRGGFVIREPLLNATQLRLGGASYDPDGNGFVLLCGDNDGVQNDVYGARWEYPQAPAPRYVGGTLACSPVTLAWFGQGSSTQQAVHIGQGFSGVRATGAPSGTAHFLAMSTGTVSTVPAVPGIQAGCRVLVDLSASNYLGILGVQVGSQVEWDLPIPEFLTPIPVYFQDWHLDGSGTRFQSSGRLELQLLR